jgi:hypothetical protein
LSDLIGGGDALDLNRRCDAGVIDPGQVVLWIPHERTERVEASRRHEGGELIL